MSQNVLRPAVVIVETEQRGPEPFGRLLDTLPRRRVRARHLGRVVRGAGLEHRPLVGKVAVHSQSLDSRPLGNGADGRPRRPHLAVQLDHRLHDPLAGLRLLLGAALLLVSPGYHVSEHICLLNS